MGANVVLILKALMYFNGSDNHYICNLTASTNTNYAIYFSHFKKQDAFAF